MKKIPDTFIIEMSDRKSADSLEKSIKKEMRKNRFKVDSISAFSGFENNHWVRILGMDKKIVDAVRNFKSLQNLKIKEV